MLATTCRETLSLRHPFDPIGALSPASGSGSELHRSLGRQWTCGHAASESRSYLFQELRTTAWRDATFRYKPKFRRWLAGSARMETITISSSSCRTQMWYSSPLGSRSAARVVFLVANLLSSQCRFRCCQGRISMRKVAGNLRSSVIREGPSSTFSDQYTVA